MNKATINKISSRVSGIALAAMMVMGNVGVVHASEPCEHQWSTTLSYNDSEHWVVCTECGTEQEGSRHAHTLEHEDGGDCTECEYHVHNYVDSYGYNETQHWQVCKYCGEALTQYASDHNYLPGTNVCLVCGYVNTSASSGNSGSTGGDSGNTSGNSGSGDSGSSSTPSTPSTPSVPSTPAEPAPTPSAADTSAMTQAVNEIAAIAKSDSAEEKVVVIEAACVSNEVLTALAENPTVSAKIEFIRNGEPVSIVISNPVVEEPADWYGPENLIGIYNRSLALQIYATHIPGLDVEYLKQLMIQDAKNARLGIAPVVMFPASDLYII